MHIRAAQNEKDHGLSKILIYIQETIDEDSKTKPPADLNIDQVFQQMLALVKERNLPALKKYQETFKSWILLSAAIRLLAYQGDIESVNFIMNNFPEYNSPSPIDASFGYAWGMHLEHIDDTYGCSISLYKTEGLAYGYHLDELNKYLALDRNKDCSQTINHACLGLIKGGHLERYANAVEILVKINSTLLRKQILFHIKTHPIANGMSLPGSARKIKMLCSRYGIAYVTAANILNDVDGIVPAGSFGLSESFILFTSAASKKLNYCQKKCVAQLKDKGMTQSIMLNWSKNKVSQEREFGTSHLLTLEKLINLPQPLNATNSIREIDSLDNNQVVLLCELYELGLRGDHLREWQESHDRYHISHKDLEHVLDQCLNNNINPIEALNKIEGDVPIIRLILK